MFLVIIPGSDPVLQSEVIVVGAHLPIMWDMETNGIALVQFGYVQ